MKRNPYNLIGLAFNLLAFMCATLAFTTGLVYPYEWAFIILMIIASIFYGLNARRFRRFRNKTRNGIAIVGLFLF